MPCDVAATNLNRRQSPAKAADEECLPFKMAYALSHEVVDGANLRVWICPESTHASWTNVRCAIRRAGLQHTILLSTIMNNCGHGPYRSGHNQQSFEEAAADLAKHMAMSEESFQELVDGMAMDRNVDSNDPSIPQDPSQIPGLPAIKNLPVFASRFIWCSVFAT